MSLNDRARTAILDCEIRASELKAVSGVDQNSILQLPCAFCSTMQGYDGCHRKMCPPLLWRELGNCRASAKYINHALPLIKRSLADANAGVRRNAAFCAGTLAQGGGGDTRHPHGTAYSTSNRPVAEAVVVSQYISVHACGIMPTYSVGVNAALYCLIASVLLSFQVVRMEFKLSVESRT